MIQIFVKDSVRANQILKTLVAKRKGPDKAAVTLKIVTLIIALAVISAAVILAVKHKFNLSLFIVGIYLFIMSLMKF